MNELDELMQTANDSLHYCDYCSCMICENFTEPCGDIRPGRLLPESLHHEAMGVWVCDQCEATAEKQCPRDDQDSDD